MTPIRRWWWRTRHRDDVHRLEATRAELARVEHQWPVIHDVVEALTRHRERNGFSESIAHIYRGRH